MNKLKKNYLIFFFPDYYTTPPCFQIENMPAKQAYLACVCSEKKKTVLRSVK